LINENNLSEEDKLLLEQYDKLRKTTDGVNTIIQAMKLYYSKVATSDLFQTIVTVAAKKPNWKLRRLHKQWK
jgi:hypothetical protein